MNSSSIQISKQESRSTTYVPLGRVRSWGLSGKLTPWRFSCTDLIDTALNFRQNGIQTHDRLLRNLPACVPARARLEDTNLVRVGHMHFDSQYPNLEVVVLDN